MQRLLATLLGLGGGRGRPGVAAVPRVGTGSADGQKPPTKIAPDANVKWKVAAPPGMSSPVIASDKLFLTAFENDKLLTVAYSRTDGKELWRKEAPAKKIESYLKTGSRAWEVKREGVKTSWGSACVWDAPGGKQVVVAGSLRVNGYDLATGAEKWVVTGTPSVPCTTPVVAAGKLVFAGWSPGGNDFKMPTFDEILEQAGEKQRGHLTKAGSEKTMLKGFFDSNDPDKDGKITRDEWDAQIKFMASGKNVAFALTPGGSGNVTKSHVAWTVEKGLPYVPSPLVYDGQMYTINMRGNLSAFDATTRRRSRRRSWTAASRRPRPSSATRCTSAPASGCTLSLGSDAAVSRESQTSAALLEEPPHGDAEPRQHVGEGQVFPHLEDLLSFDLSIDGRGRGVRVE